MAKDEYEKNWINELRKERGIIEEKEKVVYFVKETEFIMKNEKI